VIVGVHHAILDQRVIQQKEGQTRLNNRPHYSSAQGPGELVLHKQQSDHQVDIISWGLGVVGVEETINYFHIIMRL